MRYKKFTSLFMSGIIFMVVVATCMLSVGFRFDKETHNIFIRDYFYSNLTIILSIVSIITDAAFGNILLRSVRFCAFYILFSVLMIYFMRDTLGGNIYMLTYSLIVVSALTVKVTGTSLSKM
jgi:hypothetical protein